MNKVKNPRAEGLLRAFSAVLGSHTVRMISGLRCPHCQTEIRPNDVEETGDGLLLICRHCHRDILVVEEAS
jgi:hypothetical protein